MEKTSVTFVRPKNRSYEEYVKTIERLCSHLGVPLTMTESELREKYRQYVDKARKKSV
ncbi:MAG: hypothetical protein IT314_12545 [Anaerolineales bacterium]|nr:hypothetical protein [Anaerolineales bacterium]